MAGMSTAAAAARAGAGVDAAAAGINYLRNRVAEKAARACQQDGRVLEREGGWHRDVSSNSFGFCGDYTLASAIPLQVQRPKACRSNALSR